MTCKNCGGNMHNTPKHEAKENKAPAQTKSVTHSKPNPYGGTKAAKK